TFRRPWHRHWSDRHCDGDRNFHENQDDQVHGNGNGNGNHYFHVDGISNFDYHGIYDYDAHVRSSLGSIWLVSRGLRFMADVKSRRPESARCHGAQAMASESAVDRWLRSRKEAGTAARWSSLRSQSFG